MSNIIGITPWLRSRVIRPTCKLSTTQIQIHRKDHQNSDAQQFCRSLFSVISDALIRVTLNCNFSVSVLIKFHVEAYMTTSYLKIFSTRPFRLIRTVISCATVVWVRLTCYQYPFDWVMYVYRLESVCIHWNSILAKSLKYVSISATCFVSRAEGFLCCMVLRFVRITWTELNCPATSRPSYMTRSLVTRVVVATWLTAAKLGRLVLSPFWIHSNAGIHIGVRELQFANWSRVHASRTSLYPIGLTWLTAGRYLDFAFFSDHGIQLQKLTRIRVFSKKCVSFKSGLGFSSRYPFALNPFLPHWVRKTKVSKYHEHVL